MDYTGLDFGKLRYPVNRALQDDERSNQLDVSQVVEVEPNNFLSVIKINSSYMELVDRWYAGKGFNVWAGLLGTLVLFPTAIYFYWGVYFLWPPISEDEQWVSWVLWLIIFPLFLFILAGFFWLVRSESFRWTHYPMRLNRRSRQIYVFRQNGSVLSLPWDRLFVFVGESTTQPAGKSYDLRVHLLSEDRSTVLETFSLGYVLAGERESALQLWEFIRRYMECEDGVEQAYANTPICLPIYDRREGFVFSVMRTFATCARWPWMHLFISLPFSYIALCRWLAMTTSRIPCWPPEIEAMNAVDPDDAWARDWRDNPKFGFVDQTWPLICFVIGICSGLAILLMIEKSF